MRTTLFRAAIAAVFLAGSGVVAPAAYANPIERACIQSDRPGVSLTLCRCIGDAAGMTLSRSDMRIGAQFFRDPGRAQEVQLSDTRRNDDFWRRWQQFGSTAEALCS
ncbi:hypothetical protein P6F26_03125 [Roseibacterium sp. SDUM158017]|uniref:hypothetical protein n=1 Tax=Roseicyclus salinarum TaxID=3036773 RepID=UPI0024156212|nr:hypothetical protein [Roseibacterium sp. SDUM158017]MDG4647425.1 hypothetical protein [Roseibacterium sp. SDUM158017]